MSWIFLPGGLLMPAETPMDLAPYSYTQGIRNLQVRARVKSHLENFIEEYMEPLGLDYSPIQATPDMDYNFRFYTRRGEFAQAIAQTVLDIDYEKFKPEAERKGKDGKPLYKEGKEYHSVLNSIWGTVTRLGAPGGAWGGYGIGGGTVRGKYGGSYSPPKAITPSFSSQAPKHNSSFQASTPPTAAALAAAGVVSPNSIPKPIKPPATVKNLTPTSEEPDVDNVLVNVYDPTTGKTASKSIHDMTDAEWALMDADENQGELHALLDMADEQDTEPSPNYWDEVDDDEDRPFGYRTARAIRLMAEKIPYEDWDEVMDEEEIDYLLNTQTTFDEATGEIVLIPAEGDKGTTPIAGSTTTLTNPNPVTTTKPKA